MQKKYSDQEIIRRHKLEEFTKIFGSPYKTTKSNITLTIAEFIQRYKDLTKEELTKEQIVCTLAGRVVRIRQTFVVIQSARFRTQLYINKTTNMAEFELLHDFIDVGDIIEATGFVTRSNRGELTLHVNRFKLLSKSLKPLPEKYHGLVDVETRARKRYLDLISNPEVFDVFLLRSRIIKEVRKYLDENNYIEVETPILSSTVGGAAAKPFCTYYNSLNQNMFLRIATEISLKKLIVGGFERIYEIGRVFRNEGMDATHNPEFTSIEIYLAYGDMNDMMNLTENILKFVARRVNLESLRYTPDTIIDFSKPFAKFTMSELVNEVVRIDFSAVKTVGEALALAKEHKIEVLPHQKSVGHILTLFFEKYCEQNLIQPTFVYNFPVETSPLAKRDSNDTMMTQRFELYILGKEIANAYSELNDPIDQRIRFNQQLEERAQGNSEANDLDEEFLEALEYGLPPTGGLGIGIDRLVMLFTQQKSMRDVLLFPHMKNVK